MPVPFLRPLVVSAAAGSAAARPRAGQDLGGGPPLILWQQLDSHNVTFEAERQAAVV